MRDGSSLVLSCYPARIFPARPATTIVEAFDQLIVTDCGSCIYRIQFSFKFAHFLNLEQCQSIIWIQAHLSIHQPFLRNAAQRIDKVHLALFARQLPHSLFK